MKDIHKIIEKAVHGGFEAEKYDNALKKINGQWEVFDEMWLDNIIFSHNFAKAFFGTEKICAVCGESEEIVTDRYNEWDCANCGRVEVQEWWQWQLQEMVLEENPIKYLEKFVVQEE